MKLTDHEKQLIKIIDEQVNLLTDKQASKSTIISTLIDFFPEVKCILDAVDEEQLNRYFAEYKGFAYFSSLLETNL